MARLAGARLLTPSGHCGCGAAPASPAPHEREHPYSRRGIVPFNKQPSHREGYVPIAIGRRELIAALGSAAAWPLVVRAQSSDRVRRIGIFFGGFSEADPESRARIEAFTRQLQELGWIEGRNIKMDLRFGAGDDDRRRAYAAELIGMMPDAIVANSAPAVIALARQTKTLPVVFTNVFDPVASGLVASLARPGGNITGFSNFEPTMAGKWLELLKEIAPGVIRVTAMFDRSNPNAEFARTAEHLAPSLHLQYAAAPVSSATDIQNVIHAIAQESNSGLVVMGGTITSANRETIVGLAAQHRVPAIYAYRYYVTSGGPRGSAALHESGCGT